MRLLSGCIAVGLLAGFVAPVQAECQSFSSSEIRRAVIRETIQPGMDKQQVERVWGEPTKKRSNSDGEAWEYWNPAGDVIVSFAADGCVSGWRTARD